MTRRRIKCYFSRSFHTKYTQFLFKPTFCFLLFLLTRCAKCEFFFNQFCESGCTHNIIVFFFFSYNFNRSMCQCKYDSIWYKNVRVNFMPLYYLFNVILIVEKNKINNKNLHISNTKYFRVIFYVYLIFFSPSSLALIY